MAQYEQAIQAPAPSYPPRWVERYVGLPWLWGGRSLAGIDCWGLASMVLEEHFGRPPLPRFDADDAPEIRQGTLHGLQEVLSYVTVPLDEIEPGDVIEMTHRGRPHVGLAVANGWMLHTRHGNHASVIERYDRPPCRDSVHTVWRYRP